MIDGLERREKLSNSIVIITGDHPFPLGEHGITHNEAGYYDESFRVPFLFLYPDKVKPQVINGESFSHLDLTPTILDLIGLELGTHHYIGQSVFEAQRNNPVYLVQPYSGRYLSVVDYPFKLIHHVKTGRNWLFNLEKDPAEIKNLLHDKNNPLAQQNLKSLKKSIDFIFLNQKLFKLDRIWK